MQVKEDVETLLSFARPEIEAADRAGNSVGFSNAGEKYGPIAHRTYLALDAKSRTFEALYDKSIKPVLLDPWTVINRTRTHGIGDAGITPHEVEFWKNADVVKTFTDYLLTAYPDLP